MIEYYLLSMFHIKDNNTYFIPRIIDMKTIDIYFIFSKCFIFKINAEYNFLCFIFKINAECIIFFITFNTDDV